MREAVLDGLVPNSEGSGPSMQVLCDMSHRAVCARRICSALVSGRCDRSVMSVGRTIQTRGREKKGGGEGRERRSEGETKRKR